LLEDVRGSPDRFVLALTVAQAQLSIYVRDELQDLHCFFLSDVWLDHPQTMRGLQKMFDHCIENNFIPKVMVMCGNFTSRSIASGNGRDIQGYQGVISMEFALVLVIADFLYRKFRRFSGLDCIVPIDYSRDSFCLCSRASRCHTQLDSSPATHIVLPCLSAEIQDSQGPHRDQSVSYQILQPRNRDI
jgi:hypothetical protein